MIGSFAVGKTSLVKQYVENFFSEKYQSTLGVKIDKKTVEISNHEVDLILWDFAGEDDFTSVKMSYLRGAAGYIIVVDGTRKKTLSIAVDLIERAEKQSGKLPYVFLINKSDLELYWDIDEVDLQQIENQNVKIFKTSAKTGENVEAAFSAIAEAVL